MTTDNTTRNIVIGIGIVFLAVVLLALMEGGFSSRSVSEEAARAVVMQLGIAQKNVSLGTPDAAGQIAEAYGALITPDLLAAWQSDPSRAPGRPAFGPLPDRIEIEGATPQGTGYIVRGIVVYSSSGVDATSTGSSASSTAFIAQVIRGDDGEAKIAVFEGMQVPAE